MLNTIIAALFLFLININVVYAYDDGDFQLWHTEVQEKKIDKDSRLILEEEFRFADNANDFYYHHYDLGYGYNLKKYLNLSGGYRHIFEKKKGKFKVENEPYVTATLLGELFGFKFDDRSRLEYRHFDYQTDLWRYRNKFTVKFPWKFAKLEIQPYLADEIFLSSQGKTFNQNRFSSGLLFNLTKNLKAEIYYLLQSSKSSRKWSDANVLGTKLKAVF